MGWLLCKTFKATWPIDLGAIGSAAQSRPSRPRDPNAWARQGEWWERLVILDIQGVIKWDPNIKLNVWCIVWVGHFMTLVIEETHDTSGNGRFEPSLTKAPCPLADIIGSLSLIGKKTQVGNVELWVFFLQCVYSSVIFVETLLRKLQEHLK